MILLSCPTGVDNGVYRYFKEYTKILGGVEFVDSKLLTATIPKKTDMIILGGGWTDDYSIIANRATTMRIPVGLVFHSPFGQADTCNEVDCLAMVLDLLDQGVLSYLFFAEQKTTSAVKKLLTPDLAKNIYYLPTSMTYDANTPVHIGHGAVGLFGSSNPNKNIFNQLIGAGLSGYKLITNSIKFKRHYEKLINRLDLNVESHSWGSKKEYNDMIDEISVGLQCSWSEAFDYVAAELSIKGIPVVTGPTIDWNLQQLIVDNIDDPYAIALKIKFASDFTLDGKKLVQEQIMKELDNRNTYINDLFNKLVLELKGFE